MGRLNRLAVFFCAAMAAWACASPAAASGDYSCSTSWTLSSRNYDCASSIVLAPGNDTRVNLALLLRDRGGLASKGGTYPTLEWDFDNGHNFFEWNTFASAIYPQLPSGNDDNTYYGSRCDSLMGGDAAFVSAVAANTKLSSSERAALVAARSDLAQVCGSFGSSYWVRSAGEENRPPAPAWPVSVESKPAKDFVAYLIAAAAFYGEDWDAARSGFESLGSSSDAWIKETARYMQARVELNAAQATAFDEWGSFEPEKADQQAAARATNGLASYLKAYPKGLYAASAKGLERRTLWLKGDVGGLADAYETLLGATTPGSDAEQDLIQEVDNKLLFAQGVKDAVDTPVLLATLDLLRMRGTDADSYYNGNSAPIDEAELAAQEPLFKGREDLYQFLRATYSFYLGEKPQDVLRRIPDTSATTGHSALDFSRQVLRGQALAALKDPGEEAFWARLVGGSNGLYQRPAAELGLALHWEKAGKVASAFAADSPIQESMIRKIMIEHSAGPDILRAQARNISRPKSERDLALFVLLYKQLTRGYYAGYLADVKLVPAGADSESGLWDLMGERGVPVGLFTAGKFSDGYDCPALGLTVASLAKNAKDVKGGMCVGEFLRLNGFDDFDDFEMPDKQATLGSFNSDFPGKPSTRAAIYNAVIANPSAARGDKAYALYRAVRCYAPSGNNTCGGEDAPESQRKAWFTTLKRQYADTGWAKDMEYYW